MNVPEELLPVIEWWEKDGKKTLAIVAVIGAAALGYWAWTARAERMRNGASDALLGYGDVETLQVAVNKYSGEDAAPMLKLRLAAAYFARHEDGDVRNALEIYESLSGKTPAGFEDVPAVGRAECLEALGEYGDALKAYEELAAGIASNSIYRLTVLTGAERCRALSGSRNEAVANLEAMKKEFTGDASAAARIDAAIDVAKRWTKRERVAYEAAPAPEAEAASEAKTEAPADATTITLPGVTKAAPEKPVTAEKPAAEKPAAPEKPDKPDNPENPATPETPAAPATPETAAPAAQ
jgi:tetratricopeptide (TPR) repeat protein